MIISLATKRALDYLFFLLRLPVMITSDLNMFFLFFLFGGFGTRASVMTFLPAIATGAPCCLLYLDGGLATFFLFVGTGAAIMTALSAGSTHTHYSFPIAQE